MDRTPGKSKASKRRRDATTTSTAEAPEAEKVVDEPDAPAAPAPVEGAPKGKKSKSKKGNKHKQQDSPSAVSDATAVVRHTDLPDEPGNGCTSGEGATTSTEPAPETEKVDTREGPAAPASVEGMQKGKKSKDKKRKKHKQQDSPSAVSDASAVVTDTDLANESGNGCTHGEGVLRNADVASPRSGNDLTPDVDRTLGKSKVSKRQRDATTSTAAVPEAEKEVDEREAPAASASVEGTQKGMKSKDKKRKKHKQQESPFAVSDASAVVTDTDLSNEPGNGCTSGKGALRADDVVASPRSGHDPTPEMDRTPVKSKTLKRRRGGATSTAAFPEGEKEVDKQEAPGASASVEGAPKGKKSKSRKQKKQSPSAVSDASAVMDTDLANESGGGCRSGEGALQDADVVVSPRDGQEPKCPEVNSAEDLVAGKTGNKDNNSQLCSSLHESSIERKRRKKRDRRRRKKENANRRSNVQNPSLQPGAGEVVSVTTSGRNNTPGSKCKNPSQPGAGEVGLVMTADGNNFLGSECKKSNKKRKRNQTSVPEAPSVQRMDLGEPSSVGVMDGDCEVQAVLSDCQSARSDRSNVVQAHEENIRHIYSPRGSLIRFRRKKLLILDINGLLADINQDHHNAHMSHAKVRGKLVFRRPYCDDFLRFCFENFELGIWSSRLKVNVDSVVNIIMKKDMKQSLLFCWDLSKCTGTGFKTLENKNKPLVLKELKKLWNKEDPDLPWEQEEFSPSNTLLVDDSPYKALGNPPHTAIFPHPYSYLNKKDDSLGPGGDLRVYLENLATADDVQRYVQEHPFGQPSITKSDRHWNFYVNLFGLGWMEQEPIIEDRKLVLLCTNRHHPTLMVGRAKKDHGTAHGVLRREQSTPVPHP
uniref:FCP1 homology domain-containing protein n=1 Tax=Oryza punctata TaxID=4537 RepID=A0A0E0LG67_ORYPU